METRIVNPPNCGWIESKLDSEAINFLWQIINDANKDNKINLAGNISKSLKIFDSKDFF